MRLALGTGNRFPVQEFAVGAEHLARHGCAGAGGPAKPLAVQDSTPTALLLRAQGAPGALSCWAQLLPHEIEPKSGSYPAAGSSGGGVGGPMTGAIRSLM